MLSSLLRITILAVAALTAACASSRNLDESFTDIGGDAQLKGVLFTDRSHDYSDIDITIYEGRLLLTGSMRTEDGREKLLVNARKAEGVDEIISEVEIGEKTSFGQGFEDARIDQVLRAKLIADADVTSVRYKIAVSKAVVYLIGAARNQKELDRALKLAAETPGVEKVVSYVALPEPAPAQPLR